MSGGLFKKQAARKEIETICVCTIDSYMATAAVVRLFHGQDSMRAPVVLFSATDKIQGEKLSDVLNSLKRVLEQARSHGGNPDSISCVIGEPWVATIPRTVLIEKSESFKLTQKMIDEALTRDMRSTETDIRRDFPDAENLSVVDVSEIIFQVNGYRVDHVIDLIVPSVEILRSVSVMSGEVLNSIGLAVSEVFHRDDIIFRSWHHAFARFVWGEKILSLAIGGVSTQWSVIDRGAIVAIEPSQIGLVEIEKEIQHEFSISKSLIDSTMSFATDEELVANESDIYYLRIERSIESWLRAVRGSFAELQKQVDLIPKTIVLSSDVSWTASLAPVVARELGSRVAVMNHMSESANVVFAHDAHVKTNQLAQAVEYCVFRLK